MKLTLRNKITVLILSLLVLVTVGASLLTTLTLQSYFKNRIFEQLKVQFDETEYFLTYTDLNLDNNRFNYDLLTGFAHAGNIRLTLIDSDGFVLYDSNIVQDSLVFLDNHANRPEIQSAGVDKPGQDQRISATINTSLFYSAKKINFPTAKASLLKNVEFVRLAIPMQAIEKVMSEVRWKIFAGGGGVLIISALLGYFVSSKLTYPIQRLAEVAESVKDGNMEAHFEPIYHDEIGDLADLLNEVLEKLRQDFIQMRKLEKMRSQFLGNVSHELRTPIFAIEGYLETLLQNKKQSPKIQKKFIVKAYRQAVRLNTLLTELIDISRIESGDMKMSFEIFKVKPWLTKLVSELNGTAMENNVSLTLLNQEDHSNLRVLGDEIKLNQVIVNLVENAIKYNIKGGRVTISYRDLGDTVEISVSDTGRGIAKEHIPRIFERFYRVDKQRSRSVGGTGLGLAIVKHIVEAHGSSINVESRLNEGSRFSFRLHKNRVENKI